MYRGRKPHAAQRQSCALSHLSNVYATRDDRTRTRPTIKNNVSAGLHEGVHVAVGAGDAPQRDAGAAARAAAAASRRARAAPRAAPRPRRHRPGRALPARLRATLHPSSPA